MQCNQCSGVRENNGQDAGNSKEIKITRRAYLKILSQHLPAATNKNDSKPSE
jgi:hypothetical protein